LQIFYTLLAAARYPHIGGGIPIARKYIRNAYEISITAVYEILLTALGP
jgi:hypothetical protein